MPDIDKKNHRLTDHDSEDDSGKGGKSGQVEFKDFLSSADSSRDDLLSPEEKKRLLSIHKDHHEIRVKKQKELREQRQDLKDGKIPLQTYRQGLMGTGMNSEYKPNPVLADKAQFSGIDRQVNVLPIEQIAETNQDKKDELENQYRKRYAPGQVPHFNPKPQYR